jgi:hypothetical protein
MKRPCADLRGHSSGEEQKENRGADRIAEVQRHRQRIARCLAQRGRRDLDDPEDERDLGHLAVPNIRQIAHAPPI